MHCSGSARGGEFDPVAAVNDSIRAAGRIFFCLDYPWHMDYKDMFNLCK